MTEIISEIYRNREELGDRAKLHRPHPVLYLLHRLHLRVIRPEDIGDPEVLREISCLFGDRTAIGISDFEGRCQSYMDDPDWPDGFLADYGIKK